jgi:hypothetical protein
MKKLRCKIKDCSCSELIKLAQKCGFTVVEGGRHCKVKTFQGILITTIPRHNRVDRFTAKEVVESFNRFGADIEIC